MGFWLLGSVVKELVMKVGRESIDALRGGDRGLTAQAIREIIPYDAPFLFVDKVTYLDNQEVRAEYEARRDAGFFAGHFVGFPIMPGALIAEGLGQSATILIRYNLDGLCSKDVFISRIKEMSFSRQVFPGEVLNFTARILTMNTRCARIEAEADVNGEKAASCKIVQIIQNSSDFRGRKSDARKNDLSAGGLNGSAIS